MADDEDLGSLTRTQLAAACGVSTAVVEHWHRGGLLQASVRATPPGSTRPNLYNVREATVGQFLAATRQVGMTQQQLADAAAQLRRDPQLRPGWRGWAAVGGDGKIRVSASLQLLLELLESRRDPVTVLTTITTPYAHRAGATGLRDEPTS
jgi:DNA-binding transcriptional MerR regulator